MGAAQTRSYDTAIELGQKGVRYMTGLVMEGALRAPGMMAEIVNGSGQMIIDQRRTQPGYRPATIREVVDTTDDIRPGIADIDMSDDELGQQSIIPVQDDMELVESDSAEIESTNSKVTKRKKKTAPVDMNFSSGAESDDPDFQPAATRENKSSKTVGRKTTARKSTRKPKTQ